MQPIGLRQSRRLIYRYQIELQVLRSRSSYSIILATSVALARSLAYSFLYHLNRVSLIKVSIKLFAWQTLNDLRRWMRIIETSEGDITAFTGCELLILYQANFEKPTKKLTSSKNKSVGSLRPLQLKSKGRNVDTCHCT